jgi:hypothetical protein
VFNPVNQGVERFAMAIWKEEEPRIRRHVERKFFKLEEVEVHKLWVIKHGSSAESVGKNT